jgi:hypothetical protein
VLGDVLLAGTELLGEGFDAQFAVAEEDEGCFGDETSVAYHS